MTLFRLSFMFLISSYLKIAYADFSNCFQKFSSQTIDCAVPADRKTLISLKGCQEFCLSQPGNCLFAQYNYYKKTCEIYNIPSPMGGNEIDLERELASQSSHVYRMRRSIMPASTQIKTCYPSLKKALGSAHLVPNLECLIPKDRSNIRLSDPRRSQSNNPSIPVVNVPMEDVQQQLKQPRNPFAANAEVREVQMLPVVPDCPIGERARVQVIDGVEVATTASVTFNVDATEKCVEACRISMFPAGTRLPLLCRSATYDRQSHKCSVYHDSLNPNGYMEYKPNVNFLYMEKICIPDELLSASCNDVFRRVPQHILLGHAAEILTVTSQSECIRECVAAKVRGLHCRSILHYIDVPLQNCILNIHTRTSRPDYFVPELKYKVDYIELSPCAALPRAEVVPPTMSVPPVASIGKGMIQSSIDSDADLVVQNSDKMGVASVESEWSEWTTCDTVSGIRERDRQCTNCQQNVQTEPCLPNSNNEFDKALQEFMTAQEKAERSGFAPQMDQSQKIIAFPEKPALPELAENSAQNGGVEFFGPPLVEVGNDKDLRRVRILPNHYF